MPDDRPWPRCTNVGRVFDRWWNFVEAKGVDLTDWQREVAAAYISGDKIHVKINRGAGQTFIHDLLMEFQMSGGFDG